MSHLSTALLLLRDGLAVFMILGFFVSSSASSSTKLIIFHGVLGLITYLTNLESTYGIVSWIIGTVEAHYILAALGLAYVLRSLSRVQQEARYSRLEALMEKHDYRHGSLDYLNMTVEVAQEIENNMAEWEFPRLFQFAWISDFLRTATDPGVSRALVQSGHMVNDDPMIEHERLQATIHLMGAFMAYPVKSKMHSIVVARINEHHHRYGAWVNSDDVLYLIIHFAMTPATWINQFGYRSLEQFEEHALWVLWREIGCMMGVRYIPETFADAKEWRTKFEDECRWRLPDNKQAGMAMMNEMIYSIPGFLKPLFRKVIVSVLDNDIIHYCQMEDLGPSEWLRFWMYSLFGTCSFFLRYFGWPRLSPYKRTFEESETKPGVVHVVHTPYDTLPFYHPDTLWNTFGIGAILRRLVGIPAPGPQFYSNGVKVEAMGAAQVSRASQDTVERKVLERATVLEVSPAGYRPAIGFQAGRLQGPVSGTEYGSGINAYPENTPIIPSGEARFEKKWEQRGLGYSMIGAIESPEDIRKFDEVEAYGRPTMQQPRQY